MSALILIVDDTPANVLLLEAKLTSEYYNVITAANGYEALDLAKEQSPDLILLDVMMPGIDGFETCRQLKSTITTSHIIISTITT